MFGESGFAHGDLLQEHNQYAGRSLNVNGPLYRDAYTRLLARRSGASRHCRTGCPYTTTDGTC
ncbi:hypothetical protein EJ896_18560 [Klebsiella quasipneumoniae subsp. similipneumoniae]|nr:hypothetical protein EJ896_18560 [Klebsiella quasipneumoniae subsp. similipneumoniae]